MKKVFLAARYSRRQELRLYAQLLANCGVQVTSRWIWSDDPCFDTLELTSKEMLCMSDVNDLLDADSLILFNPKGRNGGCDAEFGMSIVLQLEKYIVGPRSHLYTYWPGTKYYPDFTSLLYDIRNRTAAVV